MSQIEVIAGELRGLIAGVERARGLAVGFDNQVQEVAMRAAAAGFAAVAVGVTRVRSAVSTVQGSLGGLAGTIGEATTATAAVPHEGSSQEIIGGLLPIQSAVDRVRDAAVWAIAQVGEVQQFVVMVLQGGQPGPLLQGLDSIKEVLVLIVQRTVTARQLVDAAITEARQLGASGN
ncbi:DUF6244 family protein [Micromonospora sp. NBC_01412]|uniref:DUF6244 family protein n=1 Tax=Micromonospora sp. NBC_01412 TaxID=2903590 RepID=UPI0032505354